jgi:hypothetical protein
MLRWVRGRRQPHSPVPQVGQQEPRTALRRNAARGRNNRPKAYVNASAIEMRRPVTPAAPRDGL